jgi:ABC-type phosphate/phosphonate transport system substrate-binding protein
MKTVYFRLSLKIIGLAVAFCYSTAAYAADASAKPESKPLGPLTADAFVMVVMDPLALPLSCPCVQGYAQRDYDQLAAKLEKSLRRPVHAVYSESLPVALKGEVRDHAMIVVGKHSVVEFDGKRTKLGVKPVARLTGKDGSTTQTGLIVVPSQDPAQSVADLKGYRIVFGCEECDEKHAAALTLLKKNGVQPPTTLETSPACSDGATAILDEFKADKNRHGAAVISSYAKPLLEGCGTVQKGDLRVIGETEPVPFIEAFITDNVPEAERPTLIAKLLKATSDPKMRIALETKSGFVAIADEAAQASKKKTN